MKNIFLSASIPTSDRDPKYFESADVVAIRDSILALVEFCLRNDTRIIWGGHPAITPLVYQAIHLYNTHDDFSDFHAMDEATVQKHVTIFQSEYYKGKYPKDNEFFHNIRFVRSLGEKKASIDEMRKVMLDSAEFKAAVFIGGMEGVDDEYRMFTERYPEVVCIPVASTGAASEIIYERDKETRGFSDDLLENYAYHSLFHKHLSKLR